ncbi:MAG: biotin--[acetyl-CoA-carboxylase] ligase [Gammaproteobacteria bacterium]|nr:biotin--[acetyl-CoA-carboxylase] ligase [Gammaproteobacteria bacterium]
MAARRTPRLRAPPAPEAGDSSLPARLFACLADGAFHSGEDLARALGVSRSAVWKAAGALRALGTELDAVRNRGYRLVHPTDPLAAAAVRRALPPAARTRVRRLECVWSIDSTNTALLNRPDPAPGSSEVLLAEYQSAGRGRRGRAWRAPPGGAVCASLSWTFGEVPPQIAGLSLAVGVCALRALRELGVEAVGLKWPNDLLLNERKLGGVLIELRAESEGPACVVIGVGLNVCLGADLKADIARGGLACADLTEAGFTGSRNVLTAALIAACLEGLDAFAREGLKPFLADYRAADALLARAVKVSAPQGWIAGVARGVDVHGALLIETPHAVQRFVSGEVSVRPET